jgi:hypothetical protein
MDFEAGVVSVERVMGGYFIPKNEILECHQSYNQLDT